MNLMKACGLSILDTSTTRQERTFALITSTALPGLSYSHLVSQHSKSISISSPVF